MARFIGTIRGTRAETSRIGHTNMHATVNGWDAGIAVWATIDEEGNDIFNIYTTEGSNGKGSSFLITQLIVDKKRKNKRTIKNVNISDYELNFKINKIKQGE